MKQKLIIRSEPFRLSDEELEGYMDFQGVLDRHRVKHGPFPWKYLAGFLLLLTTAAVIFIVRPVFQDQTEKIDLHPMEIPGETTIPAVPESGTPPAENKDPSEIPPETETPETLNENTASKPEEIESVDEEIRFVQAAPSGGLESLYAFFDRNLEYPSDAEGSGISGKTLVTFTVFKDGSTGEFLIESSLGETFDKEVLRVLNKMPGWIPASVNGRPVDSKISIPLHFEKPE